MAGLTQDQIRVLFAQEATVRMAQLGQLLLELEQARDDESLIRSVFREVHTIKGSAAVAGLEEVTECAHQLEELVDDLRAKRTSVSPDVIDTLLAGADRLGALITAETATPEPPAHPDTADPKSNGGPQHRPARALDIINAAPTGDPVLPVSHDPGRGAAGVIMVPTERLEELTRLVGQSASAHLRIGQMLKDRFGIDPDSCIEFNALSRSLNDLQDRATRTQMVPVSTVADPLRRAVRDLARAQDKQIRWEVRGMDTEMDRGVLHQLADSLLHLVRNAADHGIERAGEREAAGKPAYGTIRLHAMQLGSEVIITVTDDGRGIDVLELSRQAERHGIDTESLSAEERLALTFEPGVSTSPFVTDVSGRGVGLDVVRTKVEAVRGRVEVRSDPAGTEYRIIVPITLAVLRCLLVEAGGQRFALPFHRVVLSQADDPSTRLHAEGHPVIWADKQPVALATLIDVLRPGGAETASGPIVVLADTSRRHAFQVDRLVGQRDVVLKALSPLLAHLPAIAGASVEPDGSVLIVLDPPGLIQRARNLGRAGARPAPVSPSDVPQRRILVVDDALTIRELQRSILERAGFRVRVATDGRDALAKLAEEPSDLVLTDIEMPTMDGFGLTEAIRAHPTLTNIPVLILSSRSSEADRQRGLDAGADGYIIKSAFDEASLLTAVDRLIGVRS